MRHLTRMIVVVALVAAALAVTVAPASATTGLIVCNKGSWDPRPKNCMTLTSSGNYIDRAYVFIGETISFNRYGHWQFRWRQGGYDRYYNTTEFSSWSSVYYWYPRRYVDNHTWFCSRFWRNRGGWWDLPAGDWNCIWVTT